MNDINSIRFKKDVLTKLYSKVDINTLEEYVKVRKSEIHKAMEKSDGGDHFFSLQGRVKELDKLLLLKEEIERTKRDIKDVESSGTNKIRST